MMAGVHWEGASLSEGSAVMLHGSDAATLLASTSPIPSLAERYFSGSNSPRQV